MKHYLYTIAGPAAALRQRRGNQHRVCRFLETVPAVASGESSLQMVSFTNQSPGKGHGIPRISALLTH